jgi:hypothetical protein
MNTPALQVDLTAMQMSPMMCGQCGCMFALPTAFFDQHVGQLHCPNGHPLKHDPRMQKSEQLLAQAPEIHVGIGRCPFCKEDFKRLDIHLKHHHDKEQGRG